MFARCLTSLITALAWSLLLLLASRSPAAAQGGNHPTWDAPGFKDGRAHDGQEPWESIDTLNGGVTLRFTDFDLPGDNGFRLRVQRVWNSKGSAANWRIGLGDVPMWIRNHDAVWGPPTAQSGYLNGYPILEMLDGTEHPAVESPTQNMWKTGQHAYFRKDGSTLRVDLPNGLVCYYVVLPQPTGGGQTRAFLRKIDNVYGDVAELFWQDGNASTPPILTGIDHFVANASGQTRTVANRAYRRIEFLYDPGTLLPRAMSIDATANTVWDYEWGAIATAWDPANARKWYFEPTYSAPNTITSMKVTTPHGGQINYTFQPWAIAQDPVSGNIPTIVVTTRTVRQSATGAASTWTYAYPFYAGGGGTTTITGPDGTTWLHEYGPGGGYPIGDSTPLTLVRRVTKTPAGTVRRDESLAYAPYNYYLTGGGVALSQREIVQDGRCYRTTYGYSQDPLAFGDFSQPRTIDESNGPSCGALAAARSTARDYNRAWMLPGASPFLAPQVVSETVTAGGHSHVNSFAYNGNAFLTHQSLAGEKSEFGWDARGNRTWETRSWQSEDVEAASNAVTHVFEYGVPKTTIIPKGVGGSGGTIQIARTIELGYGLPLSVSRGGATTTFEYDGLGRPTKTTPPAGHPTFITYDVLSGISRVTEERSANGQAQSGEDYRKRVFTLNGFGRVIRIVDAKNVTVERILDAYGRETTTGLPGYGASTWGADTEYDVLDRVTKVTTADGARTFDYPSGNLHVTDEKGRITDYTRSAFGTPEDFNIAEVIKRSVPDENGTIGDLAFQYSYNSVGRLLTVGAKFNNVAVPGAGRSFTYESSRPRLLLIETHPESGQTEYTYNLRALLASKKPSGLPTAQDYSYDRAGRLLSIIRPGDRENTWFEYDDRDNRTRATTGYVDTVWEWDYANRMTRRQDTLLGFSAADQTPTPLPAATFQYGNFDDLIHVTYPSGGYVDNTYDRAGRLETVRLNGAVPYLYDVRRFHPSGAPEEIRFGNGTWDVRTYDARHRLDTMCTERGTPATTETCTDTDDVKLQHRDYRYDAAGNVDEVKNLINTTTSQTFTYDALDRLNGFNWPAVTTLSYDVLGNQRKEVRTSPTQPDIVSDYSNGRLDKLTQGTYSENLVYDLRGNTTQDGLSSAPYVYSTRDMMLSSTIAGATTTYTYDADQNRASKTKNGVSSLYMRGPGGTVLTEGESVSGSLVWKRDYIYAGTRLVASIIPAPPPPPQQTIVVTATALTPTVAENAGTSTVRLSFQTSDGQVVATARTLTFSTVTGTASSSGPWPDFTATTRVVTLAQNSPSLQTVDVAIPIVDNCINEPTESFSFALSSPPSWVSGTVSAALGITDNDPIVPVFLSVDPVETTIAEGVNPSVTAQLRVWTSAACTSHDVSVVVQKQSGSVMLPGVPAATAGIDYDGTAIPILVPAGTTNGAVIPGAVAILNDNVQEVTEAFSLVLTSLGGGNVFIKPADATRSRYDVASVRIRDDDSVAVGFMSGAQWGYEVNGSVMVSVQVVTDYQGPTLTPVTVSYSSAGGSATSGTDFTPVSGSFVVPAGTPHGTIYQAPVPIFNDGMGEPSETFTMSIAVTGGFAYPLAQQTIYIGDNDPAGINTEIDFVSTSQTVAESTGVAWFTIRVLTANGQPVPAQTPLWAQTYPYNTNPGPPWATPNSDFSPLPPSWFPIAAGTANGATASLALSIVNDGVTEPAEQFRLDLTSAAPGVTVFNSHTVTIANGSGFAMSSQSPASAGASRAAPKKSDLGKWLMEGVETVSTKTLPWTKVP